jgi:dTDP-4-amino-4,6-dideoxygalactose transaminase
MQPAYADLGLAPEALPIARRLADEVLSLPLNPHLTEADRERVIAAVRAAVRAAAGEGAGREAGA